MSYYSLKDRAVVYTSDKLPDDVLTVEEFCDVPARVRLIREHGIKDHTLSAMREGFKKEIGLLPVGYSKPVGGFTLILHTDCIEDEFSHLRMTTMAAYYYQRLAKMEQVLQVSYHLAAAGNMIDASEDDKLILMLLLRDWNKNNKYDIPSALRTIEYKPWEKSVCENYVNSKLEDWKRNASCTDDDMWIRPVFMVGGKRFSNYETASENSIKRGIPIEMGFTEPRRCLFACDAAEYCEQYKAYSLAHDKTI